jgi:hypothetical protein
MSKRFLFPILLAAAVTAGQAQSKISDLLAQADAKWMIGQWEARTSQGDVIELRCWLDLDGTIGLTHVKAPNMELKSVSHVDPDTQDAKYLGFSRDGAVSTGTWSDHFGDLLLKVESRHPSGQTWKAGIVHRRVSAQTMRISIHEVTASGDLIQPAQQTIELQRK